MGAGEMYSGPRLGEDHDVVYPYRLIDDDAIY